MRGRKFLDYDIILNNLASHLDVTFAHVANICPNFHSKYLLGLLCVAKFFARPFTRRQDAANIFAALIVGAAAFVADELLNQEAEENQKKKY